MFATSAAQLLSWREEWDVSGRVAALPITTVLPDADVDGPAEAFASEVRELQRRFARRST